MSVPTADETPDIRLLLDAVADLIAASSPDGDMKVAVEPDPDSDIGIKMLVYIDNNPALSVDTLTRASTTATCTTDDNHNFTTGMTITIDGAVDTDWNDDWVITVTGVKTFTFTVPGGLTTPASGTITATKDAGPNGYKVLVKDQKIKVTEITATKIVVAGANVNSISGASFEGAASSGVAKLTSAGGSCELGDQYTGADAGNIDLASPGNGSFDTTDKSIIGSSNEIGAGASDAESFWALDIEEPDATLDELGPQLVVDSHMTAATSAAYSAVGSATLSTVTNGEGGQATRALYNGTSNFGLQQSVLSSGPDFESWARIRCDASRTVRLRHGSFSYNTQVKTVGTDWVYFMLDGDSDLNTLVVQVNSSAGYCEVDFLETKKVRPDIPVSSGRYDLKHLQNDETYSEEFDASASGGDWTNTACTINQNADVLSATIDRATRQPVEYQAIDGTVADTLHAAERSISVTDEEQYSLRIDLHKLDKDWAYIEIDGDSAYVDLANGAPGTTSGIDDISLIVDGLKTIAKVDWTASSTGSIDVKVGAAQADTDNDFIGVVGVDDIGLIGFQWIEGATIADNFPYVKTEASAETGQQDFWLETETAHEYRKRLGLLERVVKDAKSNIWESPQYDDTTEYISPVQEFPGELIRRKHFAGSLGSGVNTVDLIASAAGWLRFAGSGGSITGTGAGTTDMVVPSYYSSSTYAVVRRLSKTTTDNVELAVGSVMDPCDYKVWLDYSPPK